MSVIAQPRATHELRHWDPGLGRPHVVTGTGEFDLQVAPELRSLLARLIDLGTTAFAIDLTSVTFIDSTVLGVLAGAQKQLRPHGGWLALICRDGCVRRTIEIAGMDRAFEIYPTLTHALAGGRS
jgi:anti-sigma B factor antagonist